jgi:hypothetical protein
MLSAIIAGSILAGTLTLGGCSGASSSLVVNQWSNPGYSSPSFKRIMVGGVGEEGSTRRNFEDEFVNQLKTAGVDASPSYRHIPEEAKIDEAQVKQAAQRAGADALITARAVNVEQKTEVGPYYPAPAIGIYGTNVGAIWQGPYGSPSVRRYNEYTSETTLYDLTKNEVVWTGTIKTTDPGNTTTAIKTYVEAVIKALGEKNLLGAKGR